MMQYIYGIQLLFIRFNATYILEKKYFNIFIFVNLFICLHCDLWMLRSPVVDLKKSRKGFTMDFIQRYLSLNFVY